MQYIKTYYPGGASKYALVENLPSKNISLLEEVYPGINIIFELSDSDGIYFCIAEISDDLQIENHNDSVTGKKALQKLTQEQFDLINTKYQDILNIKQQIKDEKDRDEKSEQRKQFQVKYDELIALIAEL